MATDPRKARKFSTAKVSVHTVAVKKQLERKNPQTKGTISAGNIKYEKSHPIPEKVVNQPGSPTTSTKRSKRKKNKKKNVTVSVELSSPSRSAWEPSRVSPTKPKRSFADIVSSTPLKDVIGQQHTEDLQVDKYVSVWGRRVPLSWSVTCGLPVLKPTCSTF